MTSKTECPTCGERFSSEFGVKQHHAKMHGESIAGESVDCENCGATTRKKACKIEKWDKHFCGDGCRLEYTRGENHHQYDRSFVVCDNCGDKSKKRPSRIEGREHNFCDMRCRDEFYEESGMWSGENSPSWRGGSIQPYGCGWKPLRNEVVSEDGECQSCGDCESLVVHHIKPVRYFENEEDAHYKENLVTLCRSCHPTFEHMDIEEQIERLNVPRIQVEV